MVAAWAKDAAFKDGGLAPDAKAKSAKGAKATGASAKACLGLPSRPHALVLLLLPFTQGLVRPHRSLGKAAWQGSLCPALNCLREHFGPDATVHKAHGGSCTHP